MIDASVLVNVLGDDGDDGLLARQSVAGEDLAAPEQIDVAVAAALRRHWLAKTITARRFAAAVADLGELPLVRYPALPFLPRVYELRANVSAYDAVYVALAEQLDCPLLTADKRLAAAPGPRCAFVVVS